MIKQKSTKTITGAYTTTDADNGYRIICNSASAFAITLHTATGRYNFELEIDNIGAGAVTINGQTLKQYTHAHVGNNGGTAWSVVVGGGSMSKAEIEQVLTGELTSHSHPAQSATISQATETTLGGIKASPKTSGETQEVKIDSATGKLYSTPPTSATNGLPAGGTAGQIPIKNSVNDYDVSWGDAPSGGGNPVANILGCTVWLKADVITGLNDNDSVLVWKDSAKGNNFSAIGTAPVYKTNIINGKPVVRFSGDGYYGGRSDGKNFGCTCFIVNKFSSLSNAYTGLIDFKGMESVASTNFNNFFIKSNGKSAYYTQSQNYDGTGSATYDTTNWNIITIAKKGNSDINIRRNKVLDKSINMSTAISYDTFIIGNDKNYSGRYLFGDIAEFIVYNRELSDGEISQVEEYLNTKYALGY